MKSLENRIAKLEQTRGVEEDAVAFVTRLSEKANREGWSEEQFDEAIYRYLGTLSDSALMTLLSPEDLERIDADHKRLSEQYRRRLEVQRLACKCGYNRERMEEIGIYEEYRALLGRTPEIP